MLEQQGLRGITGIEVSENTLDLPDDTAHVEPLFYSCPAAISHLFLQGGVFQQLDHAGRIRPDVTGIDDKAVELIGNQFRLRSVTSSVRHDRKAGRHRFGDRSSERLTDHRAVCEYRDAVEKPAQ